jgi:YD repeat-containing protein
MDDDFSKDLINSFETGFGAMSKVSYKPTNSLPETYGAYPVVKSTERQYVVGTSWLSDGTLNMNMTTYSYVLPLMHCSGKGFLGYQSISVNNLQNNTVTVTQNSIYHEAGNYYFNYPEEIYTYTLENGQPGVLLSETLNSMAVRLFFGTDPPVYRPVMTLSQTNSHDNDQEHTFIKTSANFVSPLDIDNYGNLRKSTSCSDKDPVSMLQPPEAYEFQQVQNITFIIDEDHWLISRPSMIETISRSETDPAVDESLTELLYYNQGETGSNGIDGFPFLKQKTVTPNNDMEKALRVTYDYDMYGNVATSERTAPNSSPALPPVTTYLEFNEIYQGRSLTVRHEGTRDQPFITTYNYQMSSGLLLSEINPQGLQTLYSYDPFYRLNEITPPDNVKSLTTLSWYSQENAPAVEAAFSITSKKLLNSADRTESEMVTTLFNKLEQEVMTITRGLNGTTIYTDKQYDQLGRLWKVSEPYFTNQPPVNWIEYRYDDLGRIVTTVLPAKSITIDYQGRSDER